MIVLFTLILILAGASLVTGSALLHAMSPESSFDRAEDRAILSIWLGIVLLANVFLGVSLLSPITVPVGGTTTAILLALSLFPRKNRTALRSLLIGSAVETRWCVIAISLGAAAYCSQVIVWYDSGLYHIQFTKWLSEFGLVPGLTLIHWRLGIASSWFAVSAPFNHGLLQGRVHALPGGFCLFLLLVHFCMAWRSAACRQGRRQDFFIIAAVLLTMPVMLVWGMPNAPTPDLPVIILEIIAAWGVLIIAQTDRNVINNHPMNSSLAILLLAAGAVTMKLSAIPLLGVACLLYVFRGGFNFSKVLAGGAASLSLLAPLAWTGLRTSGCAFFPSTLLCIDAPWSLGREIISEKSKIIKEWAKWGGAPTPSDATAWNWLIPWVKSERVCTFFILLTLAALLMILFLPGYRKHLRDNLFIPAAAISGLAFMMVTAPSWRFGLGYLAIVPALFAALYAEKRPWHADSPKSLRWTGNIVMFGTVVAALLVLHHHVFPKPSYRLLDQMAARGDNTTDGNPHFRLLLPPKQWNLGHLLTEDQQKAVALFGNRMIENNGDGFIYYTPSTDNSLECCWDAPLPCAPEKLTNVRLLDQRRGVIGGFAADRALKD